MQKKRVAIIGAAGAVGSSAAFALVQTGILDELILVDRNEQKEKGDVLDLADSSAFQNNCKITYATSYESCAKADVIIITAGIGQKPGQTRLDLVKTNAKIMTEIVEGIVEFNKSAILVVVSNPVDVLTTIAQKVSGFPPERVFGTGTLLDTGRLRHYLAETFLIPLPKVIAFALGEHGDSQFVPWSQIYLGGLPLSVLTDENKRFFSELTRNAAYRIIEKKGATYYGIAGVLRYVIEHIYNDPAHAELIPLSTLQKESGVYCTRSLNSISRKGVKVEQTPKLTKIEETQFRNSIEVISQTLKLVKEDS